MTTNRTGEAATLFDICTELENTHVALYQINNMLRIFDEHIEDEIDFLKRNSDGYTQHFVSRYDMLRSLMEVMQINLNGAIEEMRQQIDLAYEVDRKAKVI